MESMADKCLMANFEIVGTWDTAGQGDFAMDIEVCNKLI